MNNLGKILNEFEEYRAAQVQLEEALSIAQDIDFKEQVRDSYKHLSTSAEGLGNYKSAMAYKNLHYEVRDAILNEERTKATRAAEVKFETKESELQAERARAKAEKAEQLTQMRTRAFLAGIMGLLSIAYIIFSRFKSKKQKEKIEFEQSLNQAMARFVPMDFINAIGREKITDVELGDQIEKEVTVVFTDIRSFTTISEGMSPKENFAFVKEYAERMGPIIERNNGFVSQYLGDGIMAIFQDSPDDALTACIEMQRDIVLYNKLIESRGWKPIKVGMGMSTGPLIMGIIGDNMRRDATLISDTVNSAARIERTTKTLGSDILLSESSVLGLKARSEFKLEEMGEVTVKGKNIPIRVYQCLDVHNLKSVQDVSTPEKIT